MVLEKESPHVQFRNSGVMCDTCSQWCHVGDTNMSCAAIFVFSCLIPLFGDTCRDEDLFAVHVLT